ncbi:MAG: ribosome maturation factor RimM [Chloroflexota bacterium]
MRTQHPPRGKRKPSGSPTGGPVFLAVGKVLRPHGVRGELQVRVLTDFPERLTPGTVVYLGEDYRPLGIKTVRWHTKLLILRFEGFSNPEMARELVNEFLYVRSDDRPSLPEGEYYHHELLGIEVITDDNKTLGILDEIMVTGANDVYVVKRDNGSEVLLPAIDSVILDVDIENGIMRVHILPGILPE